MCDPVPMRVLLGQFIFRLIKNILFTRSSKSAKNILKWDKVFCLDFKSCLSSRSQVNPNFQTINRSFCPCGHSVGAGIEDEKVVKSCPRGIEGPHFGDVFVPRCAIIAWIYCIQNQFRVWEWLWTPDITSGSLFIGAIRCNSASTYFSVGLLETRANPSLWPHRGEVWCRPCTCPLLLFKLLRA